MKVSSKLREQLQRVHAEIERMEQSSTLDEIEVHWKEYLSQLERVWYKAHSQFGRSPGWKNLKKPFETERMTDPLLVYLRKARGIHEHTIQQITSKKEGLIVIKAGPTGSGTIKSMTMKDGKISVDVSSGSVEVTSSPAKFQLLPIKDRDAECSVPTSHLGCELNPDDIVAVAKCGTKYYEKFLDVCEESFASKDKAEVTATR